MNEKAESTSFNTKKIIFLTLISLISVLAIVLTCIVARKIENFLFGTKCYVIEENAMSKSENNEDMDVHLNAGDLIFVELINSQDDINELEAGDLITFISSNPDSWGTIVTHMIYEVKRDKTGNVVEIITFGTNTGRIDEAPVDPNFVIGKYTGKIPKIGRFLASSAIWRELLDL